MNDKSIRDQSNAPRIGAEEILTGVLEWVAIESPSDDAAAVNRMADRVQHDMGSIGAHVERIPGVDGFGAHTDYEHIFYSSLEPRAKLMLRLLQTLT